MSALPFAPLTTPELEARAVAAVDRAEELRLEAVALEDDVAGILASGRAWHAFNVADELALAALARRR